MYYFLFFNILGDIVGFPIKIIDTAGYNDSSSSINEKMNF
jgi:hypothetical protein